MELNTAAVVIALEQENKSENSKLIDRRKNNGKGSNRYSLLLANVDILEQIKIALDKGASKSAVFKFLQEKNFFDETADRVAFIRALDRSLRGKKQIVEPKHHKVMESISPPIPQTNTIPEGVEYERDGKRFTVLNGVEREIPEGYHVLRYKIRPKPVIEEKEDDEDERLDFSKLPKYIQDSMNQSKRNGTALQDADKHKQMVAEWLQKKKTIKH